MNCRLLTNTHFDSHLGTITGPLSYLTQKGNPGKFIRTSEFQELLEKTKHALISLLMLKAPVFSNLFIMAYYKIGYSSVLGT